MFFRNIFTGAKTFSDVEARHYLAEEGYRDYEIPISDIYIIEINPFA